MNQFTQILELIETVPSIPDFAKYTWNKVNVMPWLVFGSLNLCFYSVKYNIHIRKIICLIVDFLTFLIQLFTTVFTIHTLPPGISESLTMIVQFCFYYLVLEQPYFTDSTLYLIFSIEWQHQHPDSADRHKTNCFVADKYDMSEITSIK